MKGIKTMDKNKVIELVDKKIALILRSEGRAEKNALDVREENEELKRQGHELTIHAGWKHGYFDGLSSRQGSTIRLLEDLKKEILSEIE